LEPGEAREGGLLSIDHQIADMIAVLSGCCDDRELANLRVSKRLRRRVGRVLGSLVRRGRGHAALFIYLRWVWVMSRNAEGATT
jgi:hypothetical protein